MTYRTFEQRVEWLDDHYENCTHLVSKREALELAAEADAQLASKDAEIARLREDAERYRWMRQSLYWDGHAWWIPDLPVSSPDVQSGTHDEVPYPTDAEIDASVDHVIAEDARKKG